MAFRKWSVASRKAYARRRARLTRGKSSYVPRTLTSKIKNISLNQAETKTASQYYNSIDMYHNQTHYVHNLLSCWQYTSANPGTSERNNRIGNQVVARGLKIKLQLITDPAHPNQNARVIVFRYETDELPVDSNFWVGPYGAGADQNRMLDFPDTRNVTVLKSLLIQNQNVVSDVATSNTVHNCYRDIWVPLKNKKIQYDGNNSDKPKFTTIGMVVVCYDANNTSEIDKIQYLGYTSRFYYKDP